MDAFYASVEQLDNPELKGKPLAVGGDGERGVIAAASYEARKFGVKSAMTSSLAKKKCPNLIFVKPRFDRYKEISNIIRNVFYRYTDLVEPLALDEAFLDVTENITGHDSATAMARDIRQEIFEETGLTASAGISINKFTAKIASDINKPNGQKTIKPHLENSAEEESSFWSLTQCLRNHQAVLFGSQLWMGWWCPRFPHVLNWEPFKTPDHNTSSC